MNGTRQNLNKSSALQAVLIAIVLGTTTLAYAEDLDVRHAWTSIGSFGMPDTKDAAEVKRVRGYVTLDSELPQASAMIRYNISATDALVGTMATADAFELKVACTDSGDNERVRVFLVERALSGERAPSGAPRNNVLLSFDSDSDGTEAAKRATGIELDFEHNTYHLAVLLSKDGEGSGPWFLGASLTPVRAGS